ncbi:YbjN domain-containing protein [Ornithinimicrobium sp. INDO-MA30-4]|uniref:YbjN domain-containing protein n=1 Tax=Ornithinimicrobium sp. INDO-MA30-4 TaxID=2908651 RepID=UPI001F23B52A|nr:YbjN domain-containing protein [Ornithinimicrobium sp. INDO-MA30-4]UJH69625.1 YbjN domain-containing protein [Ornithinimicrobium sp. INDO-MA30-4]
MTEANVAVHLIQEHLTELGVEWEAGSRTGEVVAILPGERKLKTVVSLLVRRRIMRVRAFVIRNPDENHLGVYSYLMRRNLRLPGLAYAIDSTGDVYLAGQMPITSVDARSLDELLGAVLSACDEPFNELLALGFMSAMRTEWVWRTSRGESKANLAAFAHLLSEEGESD